jgi:predicted DNA binding CopG/RHH family protein
MKKKVPRLKTDKQAEEFLDQDLSNLDFSQFKPARFEFEKKTHEALNPWMKNERAGPPRVRRY